MRFTKSFFVSSIFPSGSLKRQQRMLPSLSTSSRLSDLHAEVPFSHRPGYQNFGGIGIRCSGERSGSASTRWVKPASSAEWSKAGDTSQNSQPVGPPRNHANMGDGPSVEVIETKGDRCLR